jgi:RNA polymerase sigma-70 factor (ECF subfamily)
VSDIAIAGFVGVQASSRELAFAAFYQKNIASLARTLTASLGDAQVAQDAAQEAMARACERWDKIQSYDNPTGWCYRVAMNWATSRWRKRRREVVTDAAPRSAPFESPDFEIQDRLLAALRELSIDHRSVIVLRLVEDWSIAETAEALGIAPGTVQSRYARALTRLRAELGDFDD